MPLPETIPVKYSEEDAEFISVRPVVRQTFRLNELLDMILSVTSKDAARVQQVLRSGTVVFHFFRYRWQGFKAEGAELEQALAAFPDADPSRVFRAKECSAVLLDTGSQTPPEWKKSEADKRRFLRRKSFWDVLLDAAAANPPKYERYSYDRKADVFAIALTPELRAQLATAGARLLPAASHGSLASLPKAKRLLLLCPRV